MSSEKGFGFAELKCQTFRGLIFWELDSFWADDNGDDWGDYLTQWVDEEEEEEEPRAMEEEEEEEVEDVTVENKKKKKKSHIIIYSFRRICTFFSVSDF